MSRLARLCGWLMGRRYRLALIVLGLALASPSLFIGLQTDDLMIRGAALRLSPAEGVRRGPWEPFTFLNGDPAACSHMLWMTTRTKVGQPLPARCLNLGPSSAPVTITRTDEQTLVVRPAAGYLLPLGGPPRPPSASASLSSTPPSAGSPAAAATSCPSPHPPSARLWACPRPWNERAAIGPSPALPPGHPTQSPGVWHGWMSP